MTTLVPLEDRVLVEPIEAKETTASGFILPEDSNEKPSRGKVVAVGAGKIKEDGTRAPMDVKEGDIIHFTTYAPDELQTGEGTEKKSYLIVAHSSILAVER